MGCRRSLDTTRLTLCCAHFLYTSLTETASVKSLVTYNLLCIVDLLKERAVGYNLRDEPFLKNDQIIVVVNYNTFLTL